MDQIRRSRSPVAMTSKKSRTALTTLPSPRKWRGASSAQLGEYRREELSPAACLTTTTMRPSSPRVLMRSMSKENSDV